MTKFLDKTAAVSLILFCLISTLQAKGTPVKQNSGHHAPTSSAASTAWSITYNDFSAFHLDGTYLTVQSEGFYFLHEMVAGKNGREERVFAGRAPTALRSEMEKVISELNISKLAGPPQRTLTPDTVVTKLILARQQNGKIEDFVLNYVKESPLDRLNEETTKLRSIVRRFELEIEKNKPSLQQTMNQAPSKRVNISKEQALKLALKKGFSATWTEVELHDTYWVISGRSKSANPPMLAVVSAFDGSIALWKSNTDIEGRLNSFTLIKASETYDVENLTTIPTWKRRTD